VYDTNKIAPIIDKFVPEGGGTLSTTYPYDVNPEGANCILNLSTYNDGWYNIDGTFGAGYELYKENLTKAAGDPPTTPNWDSSGSLSYIWAAFNRLRIRQPNLRVFINNVQYTPWIIPTYIDDVETENPNLQQFTTDCESVGGGVFRFKKSSNGVISITESFTACVCQEGTTPTLNSCETTDINNNTTLITETKAQCVKKYEEYDTFLNNQITRGNLTQQTNGSTSQRQYFNTYLFSEMGISQDDAKFIVDNYMNYSPAYYKGILDIINGSSRSKGILKNAFLNGANIWFPLSTDIATTIIANKDCCDIVGGIHKSGVYTDKVYSVSSGTYIDRDKTTGLCLCNEIKPPCPTLTDGSLVTEIRIVDGESTTYVNVPEDCCSNTSLESKLIGNWTWNGSECVLIDDASRTANQDPTVITISETPINVSDIDCVGDTVTITAYIYFEEPNGKCVDGELTNDNTPLTNDVVSLYKEQPLTSQEISKYSAEKESSQPLVVFPPKTLTAPTCCYDTSAPIEGLLIIQDKNHVKIGGNIVTYVDTFSSTQTTINTNANVGSGFNRWVKLTTVVDISSMDTTTPFSVAVEFTQGLFKSCDYNIYFDDIEVGCFQAGVREIYDTEKCPGFKLKRVIDNKKSWVYNPGKDTMSDSVEDNIIRNNGTLGMNITQTNPFVIDGGHGVINRVFAPSLDAELPFRETDYFGLHGVVEKHSKLVLNSKEVVLQFNMCPVDCIINPSFLIGDFPEYIVKHGPEDSGRILLSSGIPPNLLELERFKKTFQGFWVDFMEQFIPATTIFVSGEKWCNSRVCSEMVVNDYFLDIENDSGIISPTPTVDGVIDVRNTPEANSRIQSVPNTVTIGEEGPIENGGDLGTSNTDTIGPIIVGNTKIYSLEALDPEMAVNVKYRKYTT
jgi:hypothetical protein